ncbi:unnamed protein product [Ectocarpus sp. 6 AP-2014]
MSPKALRCVTLAALLGLAIHADTATAATRLNSSSDSSSDDSSSDSSDATAPSPVPAMHVSSAPTSAAREMSTPSPAAMIAFTAAPTMLMMPAGNGTAFNGTDTPSPNTPIPKPECNSTQAVSIRYSATTGRLYLEASVEGERGGCVTVEQIWEARGGGTTTGAKAPLYAVDPVSGEYSDVITGTWLLEEDLYVEDGITLKVWGNGSGGYADELRLKSTPPTEDGGNGTYINLRAHGGSLDFEHTKVFGWDTTNNSYDMDETDGRSYISAVSEIVLDPTQTCEGNAKNTMGEARMDIVNSEMGYMGFHDSESYGLTWKVRGFCKDKSNPEVFDQVNVYGNIYDSELHHMNFAVYTYGHQQGDWRRNTVHSNSGYGYDPHDDSDFLTIHDNVVYDNNWHGIIASKRCNNVSIQGNIVYGGNDTSAGIFLHRSSDYAIVKDNHCYGNGDAGMAMLESSNAEISGNIFEGNKYGIRMSVGCRDNFVSNNTMTNTSQYAIYTYQGSDPAEVQPTGRSQDNIFDSNTVVGGPQAIKLKESDGTRITNNVFYEPGLVEFSNTTENVVTGNVGLEDATEVELVEPACFAETDEASLAEYSC